MPELNPKRLIALLSDSEVHLLLAKYAAVLLAMVATYFIFKKLLTRVAHAMSGRTRHSWDDVMAEKGVFKTLGLYLPAMVFNFAAETMPELKSELASNLLSIYLAVVTIMLADRLLSAANGIYVKYPVSRRRPIKGYLQLVKIFIYLMGAVVAVALFVGKSPWALVSGIGALTAVLMLIFKDTILSFVASIQIATNDMFQVGDWVQMDQYGANGEVVDVALHTVKIQNWDKTITTVPTAKFLDNSFVNWRGMQDSGGRRIMRSLYVDLSSIHFLTDEEREHLENIQILKPYLDEKRRELEQWNRANSVWEASRANGRRMTNVGTFRAYMNAYLRSIPDKIRQDMILMVRQLEPTPKGLPLQVYAFTATTAWTEYETIQADIFDHLLAVVNEFGLTLYQDPSGRDVTRALGALSADGDET